MALKAGFCPANSIMSHCNFHSNFVHSIYFLLLLITASGLSFRAESKTNWGDTEVLKQLKNAVDPNSMSPGSCISSWDFTLDPCDTLFSDRFSCGFRCDVVVSGESRVTELHLDQPGYSGSLSSTSWNLPYLETLDISSNLFSGPIPESFSNLTRMRHLVLSRNSLSGEIPSSIWSSLSNLQELYLDYNYLQGAIPASFNDLISLQRLEIQSNNLSDRFPELGSLQNLTFLYASDNAISGEVPAKLPPSLLEISLRNNKLQGTIPDGFKNLSFLQVLDLANNQLSGSVPASLFEHPSLQQLTLSANRFSSIQIPSLWAIQSELVAVDLSNNQIQGLLPAFLALMPTLSALSLENNSFTGMIPTQYAIKTAVPGAGVAPFSRLLLGGNYLFGPIPSPLMGLKPDSANVRLAGNCLFRCPTSFFFCQGGDQKSLSECKRFSPVIP